LAMGPEIFVQSRLLPKRHKGPELMRFKEVLRTKYILATVGTSEIKTLIVNILKRFFSAYHLPIPEIKIVHDDHSDWLGRCEIKPHEQNTTLFLQKRALEDKKTVERIVAHELIHHWNFLINRNFEHEGHGSDFKKMEAKINSVMGKDFVTEKSDMTYQTAVEQDFYLLITPLPKEHAGKYGWNWASRPSQQQKDEIKNRVETENSKLFKSKDERFLSGEKIRKFGGISYPKIEELEIILKELYEHSTPVRI